MAKQVDLSRASRRQSRTETPYNASPLANQQASQPASTREGAPAGKPIKKATFRLDTELIEQIDDVYLECRQSAKKAKRRPVTKDQIVNAVFETVIGDPEKLDQLKKRLSA